MSNRDGFNESSHLDPAQEAEPADVSAAALLSEAAARVASLESQIEQCKPPPAPSAGGNKLGARKDGFFRAICAAPSINWTPAAASQVPVPYQTVQDLSNSVNTARSVRFNGKAAYLLDQSKQPKGTGDERGTGGGVRSGTVTGEVKPVAACATVRAESKEVVRDGDECTMNGGNNPGKYLISGPSQCPSPFDQSVIKGLTLRAQPRFDISGFQSTPSLNKDTGPRLEPWRPNPAEQQLERTRNSLGIALLGYHGVLGAIARIFTKDESIVSEANNLGASTMGIESAALAAASQQIARVGAIRASGSGVRIAGGAPSGRTNLYHATTSAPRAQSILQGIDPKYLNPESRFGAAFYVAAEPETALSELAHHQVVATVGIRFNLETDLLRVLDLTDPQVAVRYNYLGGPITSETKMIGQRALDEGFNAIKYNSERNPGGVNYAIIADHNELLKPISVSPVK